MLPHHGLNPARTSLACRAAALGFSRSRQRSSHRAWRPVAASSPGQGGSAQPPLDAILVLGGGLMPNGGLPTWVQARLHGALDLRQSCMQEGILDNRALGPPIVCLGNGTPHKPAVVLTTGHVLTEAVACAQYLISQGMPAKSILREAASFDTIGNAFFALTMHAIPAGWSHMAVISSSFHMPRVQAIFTHCFSLAPSAMSLDFHAVMDDDLFALDTLQARQAKEAESLQRWEIDSRKLPDLATLHAWLHSTHLCYATSRQVELISKPPGSQDEGKAFDSY